MYMVTLLSVRELISTLRWSAPVRARVELFGAMPTNWRPLVDHEEDMEPWPSGPVLVVNSTRTADSRSTLDHRSLTAIVVDYFLILFFLPIFPSIFFSFTYKYTDPKRFMNFV